MWSRVAQFISPQSLDDPSVASSLDIRGRAHIDVHKPDVQNIQQHHRDHTRVKTNLEPSPGRSSRPVTYQALWCKSNIMTVLAQKLQMVGSSLAEGLQNRSRRSLIQPIMLSSRDLELVERSLLRLEATNLKGPDAENEREQS